MKPLFPLAILLLTAVMPSQDAEAQTTPEEIRQEFSARLGAEVSLDELLDHALDHAPTLRAADARVALARAQTEDAARSLRYNPEIEAEVGVGSAQGPLDAVEITLSQRLEVFGQAGIRRRQADHHVDAAEAELDDARRQIRVELRHAYARAQLLQERIVVAEERVRFDDQLLQIASDRAELGEGAHVAVVLARSEAATARHDLLKAWSDYTQSLQQLAESIAWPRDTPPRPSVSFELPDVNSAEITDALERDPTLTSLRAAHAEAIASAELHARQARPDPIIGLRYEFEEPFATSPHHTLFFLVGLPLPLFDKNQGPRAAALARAELIARAVEDRQSLLSSRISRFTQAIEDTRRRLAIVDDDILPTLQEYLDLLREGFELGELTIMDVVSTRERLLDARYRRLDTAEALLDLHHALGLSLP